MPPRLTVCRCDPQHFAICACETCLERDAARDRDRELAHLHRSLVQRGMVRASALVLDARDYADRERDRADAWRMEWESQR